MGVRRRAAAGALVTAITVVGGIVGPALPAGAISPCGAGVPIMAVDDFYTTTYNTKLVVSAPGVLTNDCGGTNTKVVVTDSDDESDNGASITWGSASNTGKMTYAPDTSFPFTGIDTFEYWIRDPATDEWDFATVSVTVKPILKPDTYYAKKDSTLVVDDVKGVLANDLGVDSTTTFQSPTPNLAAVFVDNDGSFVYAPASGFTGTDTFWYRGLDLNFDNDYKQTATVIVDGTAPVPSITTPSAAITLTGSFKVGWTATDDLSGVAKYRVQVRNAPWNKGFGSWADWKASTTGTGGTYSGTAGRTYCFRVKATDRSGNVSGWSPPRCTTVPLKSASLAYSSGWSKVSSSTLYGGVGFQTAIKGSRSTRTTVVAKGLSIVVTKCPGCGTVKVAWNGSNIATVNLDNATTVHKKVVGVALFASQRSGTVTVTVSSPTFRTVLLEGLAVRNK
jgi:hypothetical protein